MSVLSRLESAEIECYTRKEWGSPRERDGAYDRRKKTHPVNGAVPFHYLHISVTGDTDTVAQGAAGARQIETFGYSSPPMVSYQLLVTNEGKVFEGQNYGVKGTHTVNDKDVAGFPHDLNRSGYAVAIMQNVDDAVTDIQVHVLAAAFAAAELEGYVKRGAPIYPHRKFAWKACPGDRAVARLDEIQKLKDKYVRDGIPNLNGPTPNRVDRAIDRIEKALAELRAAEQIIDQALVHRTPKGEDVPSGTPLALQSAALGDARAAVRKVATGLEPLSITHRKAKK